MNIVEYIINDKDVSVIFKIYYIDMKIIIRSETKLGVLFGTDGVRGIANEELTGELAYKLGRAGGHYLTKSYQGDNKPVMLIGKDTRVSGDMLESALIAGMTSTGIDVIKLGVIPTPGVAYLTRKLSVQGGVMISASHNPIADNGIKFFDYRGYKLTDEAEDEIEDLIFKHYQDIPAPTHEKIGNAESNEGLVDDYIEYLIDAVDVDFTGLKVVIDCANGAAYKVAPRVLASLGAELIVLNNHPDGSLINVNCGSTHPEIIKQKVVETGAVLGIAHDGDADRIVMVDEEGEIIDGDKIMAIWALDLLQEGRLAGRTLVTTAYSNLGLREVLEARGGRVVITDNGDRYVLKAMLEGSYNLGGEKSGHIICLDYNSTGDGVLTAIKLVEIVKKRGRSLRELAQVMKPWPQRLKNIEVKFKDRLQDSINISEAINRAEERLGKEGRIFVRASGTEPVIRVMLEGKDEALLIELEEEMQAVISKELK